MPLLCKAFPHGANASRPLSLMRAALRMQRVRRGPRDDRTEAGFSDRAAEKETCKHLLQRTCRNLRLPLRTPLATSGGGRADASGGMAYPTPSAGAESRSWHTVRKRTPDSPMDSLDFSSERGAERSGDVPRGPSAVFSRSRTTGVFPRRSALVRPTEQAGGSGIPSAAPTTATRATMARSSRTRSNWLKQGAWPVTWPSATPSPLGSRQSVALPFRVLYSHPGGASLDGRAANKDGRC
jgi:hypothetical protein